MLLAEARRTGRSWLWSSVALACVTSVLGYLSLAASRLWLVREFGLVLGVAVVLSYLAARLVLWWFPPAPPPGRRVGVGRPAVGYRPARAGHRRGLTGEGSGPAGQSPGTEQR